MSTAFGGRGEAFGRSLTDFNAFLATIEPSLPQLSNDLRDAARRRDRLRRRCTRPGRHREERHPDQPDPGRRKVRASTGSWCRPSAWPTSATTSSAATATRWRNLMHLLVPTTDLTNEYHEALTCGLTGISGIRAQAAGPDSRGQRSRRHSRLGSSAIAIRRICRRSPPPAGHSARGSYRSSSTTLPAQSRRRRRHESLPIRQRRVAAELRRCSNSRCSAPSTDRRATPRRYGQPG